MEKRRVKGGRVPIDAGYSSVKIYSFMFSGSKDLYNEHLGASNAQPRSKLERQLKWKLSPDDSAHKWTRLYG